MTDTTWADPTIPEHAHEFDDKRKVRALPRVRDKLGRFLPGRLGAFGCAVPGISLTDYSRNAQAKGWGPPCEGARKTITLTNGVRVTVRAEIAELTTILMNECLRRGYVIRPADTGAYNCRKIAGTTRWSNHAWALAIDINWQLNPMRKPLTTNIPTWMVQLFNRFGFAWGGHYSGTPDSMHFEFMGTPAQAGVATDMARRELVNKPVPPPPPTGGLPFHANGSRTLRLATPNMRGTDVAFIQRWMAIAPADGVCGPGTDRGVKAYQSKQGLTADGVVGPGTWGRILGR